MSVRTVVGALAVVMVAGLLSVSTAEGKACPALCRERIKACKSLCTRPKAPCKRACKRDAVRACKETSSVPKERTCPPAGSPSGAFID